MKIIRAKDYYDMSRKAANIISAQVIMKPNCVLGLATGGTPVGTYKQLVEWYNKGDIDFSEVTTVNLDEYRGLLIRTPENPVIMATMTALGANPQPLSFSELYQALQQKTYDAQENPIPVIYNNNLFEVQEYLSITNHIYSGMCFTIAESSWNKLSADQQQIVSDAAKASAD